MTFNPSESRDVAGKWTAGGAGQAKQPQRDRGRLNTLRTRLLYVQGQIAVLKQTVQQRASRAAQQKSHSTAASRSSAAKKAAATRRAHHTTKPKTKSTVKSTKTKTTSASATVVSMMTPAERARLAYLESRVHMLQGQIQQILSKR